MTQIYHCSATSWSDFHQVRKRWLKGATAPSIILLPAKWSTTQFQSIYDAPYAFTIPEFLQRYVHNISGQKHLLAKTVIRQLLHEIIYTASEKDGPVRAQFLNIETSFEGYIRALTEFIIDFRENGQTNLLTALKELKGNTLSMKERDLLDIFNALEAHLEKNNLFDFRRAVQHFSAQADHATMSELFSELDDHKLVIFGFSHFTEMEYLLMQSLISCVPLVLFAQVENANAAPAVFKCNRRIADFFQNENQQHTIKKITFDTRESSAPQALSEAIFQENVEQRQVHTENSIIIKQANDRYQEMVSIAREIKQRNQAGTPFRDMQIIAANYDLYATLAAEVFPRYGIPHYSAHGLPPACFPLAQLIMQMVEHAISPNPFALRDKIFASPYVTFRVKISAPALQHFLEDTKFAGLIDAPDFVQRFLPEPREFTLEFEAVQRLQKKAGRVAPQQEFAHPLHFISLYFQEKYKGKPAQYQHALFDAVVQFYLISQAVRALNIWQSKMTTTAFCEALRSMLAQFNLPEKNSALQEVHQQDEHIFNAIEKCLHTLEAQFSASAKKHPLSSLIQGFTQLLTEPEFYVSETRKNDAVRIVKPVQAMQTKIKCSFWAGLVDGEFPAQEAFNFLHPKKSGRKLSEGSTDVDRDRHLFYQIANATRDTLYLSYPFSDSGKKMLVSPLITETQKCLETSDAESKAVQDAIAEHEKIAFIAKHIDRETERALPVLKEFKNQQPQNFATLLAIFRCDGLRNSTRAFSAFDGLIDSANSKEQISQKIGEVPFSIEKIDRFAGCSLRFLFDDLMGLKPEGFIDYHPDRFERGMLLRQILKEFSAKMATETTLPQNAETLLHNIAKQVLENQAADNDDFFSTKYKNGLLAGLKISNTKKRQRPGILAAFIKNERERIDLLEPFQANLHFDGAQYAFKIDDHNYTLEIDRIDQTQDGKNLMIYYYSTADVGNVEKIAKGLEFNLPLQILALQHHIDNRYPEKSVIGAGTYLVKSYRNIKKGGYFARKEFQASRRNNVTPETPVFSGQRKYGFLPQPNFEQELQRIKEKISSIPQFIAEGRFHLPVCAEKDQTCPNCSFARICRKDQLRLDRIYGHLEEEKFYKPLRVIKK